MDEAPFFSSQAQNFSSNTSTRREPSHSPDHLHGARRDPPNDQNLSSFPSGTRHAFQSPPLVHAPLRTCTSLIHPPAFRKITLLHHHHCGRVLPSERQKECNKRICQAVFMGELVR